MKVMPLDLRDDLWGLAEDTEAMEEGPARTDFMLRPWESVLELGGASSAPAVGAPASELTVDRATSMQGAELTARAGTYDVVVVTPEAVVADLDLLLAKVHRSLARGGRLIGRLPAPAHLGTVRCTEGSDAGFTLVQLAKALDRNGFTVRLLEIDSARRRLLGGPHGLEQLRRHIGPNLAACKCEALPTSRAPLWNGRQWTVITSGVRFAATKGEPAASAN